MKRLLDYLYCLVFHRLLMNVWLRYIGQTFGGRKVFFCPICRRNRLV